MGVNHKYRAIPVSQIRGGNVIKFEGEIADWRVEKASLVDGLVHLHVQSLIDEDRFEVFKLEPDRQVFVKEE